MSKILPFLRIARSMRFSLVELVLLYEIRSVPGIRIPDLCARMERAHGAIHAALQRLQDRGFVDIRQPKLGKHITGIFVTPAGAAVCQELESKVAA